MTITEQIEALHKQLQQIGDFHLEHETPTSVEFIRWQAATKRCIKKIFGDRSEHFEQFDSINYAAWSTTINEYQRQIEDRNAYLSGLRSAKTHLLVMIDELNERELNGEPLSSRELVSHEVNDPVMGLIQVLKRFRGCCQHLANLPQEEKDVQDILWIILRAHFDHLKREETLPKFGVKSYSPDFGIPELRILIEVKFVGEKTKVSAIQEAILADIPGYLHSATDYDLVVIFVYDASHQLRDDAAFIRDLETVQGISEVVVVPGLK